MNPTLWLWRHWLIDENIPLTLARDLNSPSDDEEDENDNEVSFASKENASPSAPSSPMSPQPQLVTGDLGKMCAIM